MELIFARAIRSVFFPCRIPSLLWLLPFYGQVLCSVVGTDIGSGVGTLNTMLTLPSATVSYIHTSLQFNILIQSSTSSIPRTEPSISTPLLPTSSVPLQPFTTSASLPLFTSSVLFQPSTTSAPPPLFTSSVLFQPSTTSAPLPQPTSSVPFQPSTSPPLPQPTSSVLFQPSTTSAPLPQPTSSVPLQPSAPLPLFTLSIPFQPSTSPPLPQPTSSVLFQSSTTSAPLPLFTSSVLFQPSTSAPLPQPTSSIPFQPSTTSALLPLFTSSVLFQPSTSAPLPQPTSSQPSTTSATLPQPTSSQPSTTSGPLPLFTSTTSIPSPTTTMTSPSTIISLLESIWDELGISGVIGLGVVLTAILILLSILCCLCCYCICKRVHKYKRTSERMDISDKGFSFENRGARTEYDNGVTGTSYRSYNTLELHQHHHDNIDDPGNYETCIDKLEFPHNEGDPSQPLASQISVANTELFQRNTLPELSPMSYSLTANYPFHSEGNGLYLPASTPSLRQPTMFGLSLQQEESKSTHGSHLSMSGSKASIHGSRPSIYGSRTSGLHGSRHLVYNSATSRDSLLGCSQTIENSSDVSLSNQISISTQPLSTSESMEVPTRESPQSRPLLPSATSHLLGHGKKDFASLTCIPNYNAESPLPPSPEPTDEGNDKSLTSPQRKAGGKRNLTSLTSVTSPTAGDTKFIEAITEEEVSEGPKVKKNKDASPSTKKGRSRPMSKLEKLTSLDYIRQSFRLKKKKVSFQNIKTPEATPKSAKKNSKKTTPTNDTVFSNVMSSSVKMGRSVHSHGTPQQHMSPAHGHGIPQQHMSPAHGHGIPQRHISPAHGHGTPQRHISPAHGHGTPQRRISTESSDLFSPTETMFSPTDSEAFFEHSHGDHPMAMYGQLSQPSYYLTHAHYPYPQLSQQYYPQLSQGYIYHPQQYHIPIADPFSRGGYQREHMASRYQEVITPDYSDITTPDHYRQRALHSPEPNDRQGSEYSYELRSHSPEGSYNGVNTSPKRYKGRGHSPDTEISAASEQYRSHSPDDGELQFGIHPEYNDSFIANGYLRSPSHHYTGTSPNHPPINTQYMRNSQHYKGSSPERYGVGGHGLKKHGGEQEKWVVDGEIIPEESSTSVDPSPQHYAVNHKDSFQNQSLEKRYSGYSESSTTENRFADSAAQSKNVSWNTTVVEYPAHDSPPPGHTNEEFS